MAEQAWTAPPEGAICWIEIPGRDVDKLKASSRFLSLKSRFAHLGNEGVLHRPLSIVEVQDFIYTE